MNISGSAHAIAEAIHEICIVKQGTPGKGPKVAYTLFMSQPGPVGFCSGQAYTLEGSLAIPAFGDQLARNTTLNTIASIAPNSTAGSG